MKSMLKKIKKTDGKLFFIIILALILRFIAINQSFWLDEATSGIVIRNLNFSQIISEFSPGDFHPPLYYFALKLWYLMFGSSEIALRSLSVIFGIGSVYLAYLVGKFINEKVGLISALFLAVNGLHIYYSQEARMYSMSVFLVLLLIYLYSKILSSKKSKYWYIFSLTLVLNAFTDYLPNLIILVFWLYAIINQKKGDWWKKFVLAHIPLIFVSILWMPYAIMQVRVGISVKESGSLWWGALGTTSMKNILLIPVKFVFGRISLFNKTVYYGLSTIIISAYILIVTKCYKKLIKEKYIKLIIIWLIMPVFLSIIIGFRVSVLSYFRLIYVLPALMLVLAVSIINLPKNRQKLSIAFIVLVSILSSANYLLTPRFHRENWRGLVFSISSESENPNFKVVFASKNQREGYKYYKGPENVIIEPGEITTNLDKLWYIRYVHDIFDPNELVKDEIEGLGYERKKIQDFNGIIVWEYENRN